MMLHLLVQGQRTARSRRASLNYLVNSYQKLDFYSRAEAVAWVWQYEKLITRKRFVESSPLGDLLSVGKLLILRSAQVQPGLFYIQGIYSQE